MLGGVQSYFGYEYQFQVTVLLMLLAHKDPNGDFSNIRIETTFGQDAELDYTDKELNVRQVCKSPIQVQIKTKAQTYQWTPSDIRDLLLKQDESIPNVESVLKHLANTDGEIFIFITDGILIPTLAGLLGAELGNTGRKYPDKSLDEIRSMIIQSDQKGIHRQDLEQYLTNDVLKKLLIFSSLSSDDVRRRIQEILLWDYGIPMARIKEISKILLDLVRDCARRTNGKDSITAEEIKEIIGDAGLALPYQLVESTFETPRFYGKGLEILNERHLLIIGGEPAVGKTTLGQKYLNQFSLEHYSIEELHGADSYLKIIKACRQSDNVVFFLNDPFGYDDYDPGLANPLGNQLHEIASQLSQAKGRVKLIITSRSDVISKVLTSTILGKISLDGYRITLPIPEIGFIKSVLSANLRFHGLASEGIDFIVSQLENKLEDFEDLLHVRGFANQIYDFDIEITNERIQQAINESRPSLYKNWVANQSAPDQLLLLSLWLLVEVNQVAYEVDVQRVFEQLESCYSLPHHQGIGSNYLDARQNLLDHDRLRIGYSSRIDFIHPYLRIATRNYFQQHPGFTELLNCLVDILKASDNPVDQSIAAAIVTIYYELLGMPLELLQNTYTSRYLQVKDTVVRFGTQLLSIDDDLTKQFAEGVFRNNYGPADCTIDQNGFITLRKPELGIEHLIYSLSDVSDALIWHIGYAVQKDPELEIQFKDCVSVRDYQNLNALQRYLFVDWLTSEDLHLPHADLIHYLDNLSIDTIAFVRARVATRMGVSQSLEDPETFRIFNRLCFDSSPYVKIAALEDGLLRNWANLSPEMQEHFLEITIRMLDDPVVRSRAAMGLIDESGSRYYYHQHHTLEQKRVWFEKLAPYLLENDFEDYEIDRFLGALDEHYNFFTTSFRVQLISSLERYVLEHPYQATYIPLTIEHIILETKPSIGELDIILRIISQLPPIAKASICFRLAYNYEKLSDQRFRDFVHRPFYAEEQHEFVVERAAGVLGFLSNTTPEKNIELLPEPLRNLSEDFESAIKNYIETQSEEFRYMLISHSYGYEYSSDISAVHHNLYSHPIIMDQINYFIGKGSSSEFTIFVMLIFLGRGYYLWDDSKQPRSVWWKFVDDLLEIADVDFLKTICDVLFAYNVSSNVQNIRDWMIILSKLLRHYNDEVRVYAFSLFDQHFLTIWEEFVEPVRSDENKKWRKEADDIWYNDEFIKYLVENSPSFYEYLRYQMYSREAVSNWDELSDEKKKEIVTTLCGMTDEGKYYLVYVVNKFIQVMENKLHVSDKELLQSKITIVNEKGRKDTLGRLEQIEFDERLRDREPEFDWSKYIQ